MTPAMMKGVMISAYSADHWMLIGSFSKDLQPDEDLTHRIIPSACSPIPDSSSKAAHKAFS